jgi:hypothetical protein
MTKILKLSKFLIKENIKFFTIGYKENYFVVFYIFGNRDENSIFEFEDIKYKFRKVNYPHYEN